MPGSRMWVALLVAMTGVGMACTQSRAAALCAAIAAGDVPAAERALAGGDTDMLGQQGLCHAAFDVIATSQGTAESRLQILRLMLKAGLDANATLSRTGAGRSGGRSSTTTQSLVEWANSDRRAIEVLLSAGLDTTSAAAGRAVANAAGGGLLDVVQLLVDAGASVNEPLPNQFGLPSPQTALGLAVVGRHHDVIAFLEARRARFALVHVSPVCRRSSPASRISRRSTPPQDCPSYTRTSRGATPRTTTCRCCAR